MADAYKDKIVNLGKFTIDDIKKTIQEFSVFKQNTKQGTGVKLENKNIDTPEQHKSESNIEKMIDEQTHVDQKTEKIKKKKTGGSITINKKAPLPKFIRPQIKQVEDFVPVYDEPYIRDDEEKANLVHQPTRETMARGINYFQKTGNPTRVWEAIDNFVTTSNSKKVDPTDDLLETRSKVNGILSARGINGKLKLKANISKSAIDDELMARGVDPETEATNFQDPSILAIISSLLIAFKTLKNENNVLKMLIKLVYELVANDKKSTADKLVENKIRQLKSTKIGSALLSEVTPDLIKFGKHTQFNQLQAVYEIIEGKYIPEVLKLIEDNNQMAIKRKKIKRSIIDNVRNLQIMNINKTAFPEKKSGGIVDSNPFGFLTSFYEGIKKVFGGRVKREINIANPIDNITGIKHSNALLVANGTEMGYYNPMLDQPALDDGTYPLTGKYIKTMYPRHFDNNKVIIIDPTENAHANAMTVDLNTYLFLNNLAKIPKFNNGLSSAVIRIFKQYGYSDAQIAEIEQTNTTNYNMSEDKAIIAATAMIGASLGTANLALPAVLNTVNRYNNNMGYTAVNTSMINILKTGKLSPGQLTYGTAFINDAINSISQAIEQNDIINTSIIGVNNIEDPLLRQVATTLTTTSTDVDGFKSITGENWMSTIDNINAAANANITSLTALSYISNTLINTPDTQDVKKATSVIEELNNPLSGKNEYTELTRLIKSVQQKNLVQIMSTIQVNESPFLTSKIGTIATEDETSQNNIDPNSLVRTSFTRPRLAEFTDKLGSSSIMTDDLSDIMTDDADSTIWESIASNTSNAHTDFLDDVYSVIEDDENASLKDIYIDDELPDIEKGFQDFVKGIYYGDTSSQIDDNDIVKFNNFQKDTEDDWGDDSFDDKKKGSGIKRKPRSRLVDPATQQTPLGLPMADKKTKVNTFVRIINDTYVKLDTRDKYFSNANKTTFAIVLNLGFMDKIIDMKTRIKPIVIDRSDVPYLRAAALICSRTIPSATLTAIVNAKFILREKLIKADLNIIRKTKYMSRSLASELRKLYLMYNKVRDELDRYKRGIIDDDPWPRGPGGPGGPRWPRGPGGPGGPGGPQFYGDIINNYYNGPLPGAPPGPSEPGEPSGETDTPYVSPNTSLDADRPQPPQPTKKRFYTIDDVAYHGFSAEDRELYDRWLYINEFTYKMDIRRPEHLPVHPTLKGLYGEPINVMTTDWTSDMARYAASQYPEVPTHVPENYELFEREMQNLPNSSTNLGGTRNQTQSYGGPLPNTIDASPFNVIKKFTQKDDNNINTVNNPVDIPSVADATKLINEAANAISKKQTPKKQPANVAGEEMMVRPPKIKEPPPFTDDGQLEKLRQEMDSLSTYETNKQKEMEEFTKSLLAAAQNLAKFMNKEPSADISQTTEIQGVDIGTNTEIQTVINNISDTSNKLDIIQTYFPETKNIINEVLNNEENIQNIVTQIPPIVPLNITVKNVEPRNEIIGQSKSEIRILDPYENDIESHFAEEVTREIIVSKIIPGKSNALKKQVKPKISIKTKRLAKEKRMKTINLNDDTASEASSTIQLDDTTSETMSMPLLEETRSDITDLPEIPELPEDEEDESLIELMQDLNTKTLDIIRKNQENDAVATENAVINLLNKDLSTSDLRVNEALSFGNLNQEKKIDVIASAITNSNIESPKTKNIVTDIANSIQTNAINSTITALPDLDYANAIHEASKKALKEKIKNVPVDSAQKFRSTLYDKMLKNAKSSQIYNKEAEVSIIRGNPSTIVDPGRNAAAAQATKLVTPIKANSVIEDGLKTGNKLDVVYSINNNLITNISKYQVKPILPVLEDGAFTGQELNAQALPNAKENNTWTPQDDIETREPNAFNKLMNIVKNVVTTSFGAQQSTGNITEEDEQMDVESSEIESIIAMKNMIDNAVLETITVPLMDPLEQTNNIIPTPATAPATQENLIKPLESIIEPEEETPSILPPTPPKSSFISNTVNKIKEKISFDNIREAVSSVMPTPRPAPIQEENTINQGMIMPIARPPQSDGMLQYGTNLSNMRYTHVNTDWYNRDVASNYELYKKKQASLALGELSPDQYNVYNLRNLPGRIQEATEPNTPLTENVNNQNVYNLRNLPSRKQPATQGPYLRRSERIAQMNANKISKVNPETLGKRMSTNADASRSIITSAIATIDDIEHGADLASATRRGYASASRYEFNLMLKARLESQRLTRERSAKLAEIQKQINKKQGKNEQVFYSPETGQEVIYDPKTRGFKKIGYGRVKCQLCDCNTVDDLYELDGQYVLCADCIENGVYPNRKIIPRNVIQTPLRQTKKYGGSIKEDETMNEMQNKNATTSWKNFENSMNKKIESRKDLKKILTNTYLMYGDADENMLDTLTYSVGLATHYYDHLDEIPPMLMTNIYSGLTKFAQEPKKKIGKGIKIDKLGKFDTLKEYIRNSSFELLSYVTQK